MKKYITACLITLFLILNVGLFRSVDAADTGIVTVNATVLSKNQCKFNSAGAALAFGNLDPANPVDRTVSTSVTFRCMGSSPIATFFISDDDGLYETGPNANRMRHATLGAEYIPYIVTLNPTSGTIPKNTDQTLTISGAVTGIDYQNSAAGNYSDSIILIIAP